MVAPSGEATVRLLSQSKRRVSVFEHVVQSTRLEDIHPRWDMCAGDGNSEVPLRRAVFFAQ